MMMRGRTWMTSSCAILFAACQPHEAVPDGTIVIDETVALERQARSDVATRTLTVNDDSIVVAFADEELTDVRLKLSAVDASGKPLKSFEVENYFEGSALEIAALAVPEDAKVTVTLTSRLDATVPGTVALRVRLYSSAASSKPGFTELLGGFKAWSNATDSGMRPDAFRKAGLANMNRAIASLESEHGDSTLAAEARLAKAWLLYHHKIDFRESRAEAQRAARAFASLPKPDAVNVARARFVESLALMEMADDANSVDPTPAEAYELVRAALEAMSAPDSILGPIERARAHGFLGTLACIEMRLKEATAEFEQARSIYQSAGWTSGEREMRFSLAMVLVAARRFGDAAEAFDPLLAEIDALGDPEFRVESYLVAAHAQINSNRQDEGLSLLLKALAMAREYQLREFEAVALQGMGSIYQARGDFQQASALYVEMVEIARTLKNSQDYSIALHTAARVARNNGDMDLAFKLASESVRVSTTPMAKAHNYVELALLYRQTENFPAAIAVCRTGLAVDLGDPRHHQHTDGKLQLAQALTEQENMTPKDGAEAESLIAEAIETSVAMKDRFREIQTRNAQARIKSRLGKTREALTGFRKTLELAQEHRSRSSSSEVRASMLRDEQIAFRGLLDIALADVARRPAGELRRASPAALAAFLELERARQRSFGGLRVGVLDAPTEAKVDDLLQQMGQKSLRIAALLGTKLDAAGAAELQSLQLDMSRLHAELDGLRASAAAKQEQVAMKLPPARETWRMLAPGAAHVSYAFGEEYVYVLVRGGSGTRVTRLEPSRKVLEQQLAELSQLDVRTASREIDAALERASAVLLPAGLLPTDSSSVAIVAEGRIASVPFPALRSPTDPQRRLVETHEVAMVTTLLDIDQSPRQEGSRPFRFVALASGSGTYRAATVADPVPRLNAARKEIGAAAALFSAQDPRAKIRLFSGSDGDAAALRDIWASGADVVHFATHALADLRQPIASLLVLPATDANGKATYLTAGQVQSWRGDAELVFLSACESAIGPPQYAAGMPGLQRAFLRAGARGVIATLAPIEDVLAQQFSEDFYLRYTKGVPAARALSEIQRAWLMPKQGTSEADLLRRRITALSHAYFTG